MGRCKSFLSLTFGIALLGALTLAAGPAAALADCRDLPNHAALKAALQASVFPTGGPKNGGFELQMWATLVDRDGQVCAVAFSGADRGAQWPGSRVISAQKANTANAFSLDGLALSTANLFSLVQPGGSLFGLQFSNPVDTAVAYGDNADDDDGGGPSKYGKRKDPMVGHIVGGVNVFGGGLAAYDGARSVVGAIGVSGDTSCADHNIAWRVRAALGLDNTPNSDAIVYDTTVDPNTGHTVSPSGFGHASCGLDEVAEAPVGAVIVP